MSLANSPQKISKKFKENEQWKSSNKGRINSVFTDKTPSVSDCTHLIKKYPVKKEAIDIQGPDHMQKDKMTDYLMGLEHVVKMMQNEQQDNHKHGGDDEPKKGEGLYENGISSQVLKKCIDAMSKNIDHMARKNEVYYHGLMARRVTE